MNKKYIVIFIASIIAFVLIGVGFEVVAGAEQNVSGWAWSANIGWISFNNSTGGGAIDYGVNIEPDGKLTGHAWSANIGWISFKAADLVGCPIAPCEAKVNLDNQQVSGWARALAGGTPEAGGWDGWIRLRGPNYGVWIDATVTPHQFRGWAWGGDPQGSNEAVIGWISFNCANPETGNVCGASNYKVVTDFVFNRPPTVSNMVDPDNAEIYCGIAPGLGQVGFKWQYNDLDGDSQLKFDFRVNNVNNVNDPLPEIDRTINNPVCTDIDPGPAISCINTQTAVIGTDLSYATPYFWWIRVHDNQGNNSGWVSGPAFTTASHAWPWPDFTFLPKRPSIGEEVRFFDNSRCFDANNVSYYCRDKNNTYLWTFNDGTTSSERGDVTHIYTETGIYTVTLRITDHLNPLFSCEVKQPVNIFMPLPGWEEIMPR